MRTKPKCCAVIVAAGNSERMALGYSKQFIPLCGVPAIVHTLSAFDCADLIDGVVIVCREEDFAQLLDCIESFQLKKVIAVVQGGATRQESVAAGIAAVPEDTAYFAIHDGARALITPDEINSAVKDAFEHGASSLAVSVKDTIKVIGENNFVASTPERSELWAVQTPQVFERGIYLEAMEQAKKESGNYSDDCQLVEQLGVRVHLCKGEYTNIKLTTREDICFAEAVLKTREEER
jgi:2-C-methyl-D-erythritol 4-phosphate cytidylyltransferase